MVNKFVAGQLTKIEDIYSKKDYFYVLFENSNNLFIAHFYNHKFLLFPKRQNSKTFLKKK